ncbi:hypothetical protein [Arthrobacter sp. NPDC057013]|uniref:hypothetical protein n=1 Tax=Arthrobacter sp. NPDC057013 TaxID=3345999 RepID=UPI0036300A87
MTTQQSNEIQQQAEKLRELFADAPEVARVALEKELPDMQARRSASRVENAGRVGKRLGKVSELTLIAPVAPGGAKRMRALMEMLDGNFEGADRVGTVHDMRFVFLDNDTKMLFTTAYDGNWDDYIDDFVTKIPNLMDIVFSAIEDWPGIHDPSVKDIILKYQLTADAWYVANPDLTVVETRRLQRVGAALDEFLDKIG